ncbi:hypothetical protein [Planobispora longispora]|uniref:Uncharacterized protein n=1 Tax=Planobispora longispora TaxID=28887 RepID=A0A8J3RJ82_9ACTN|nr:hypothetical protein [Planobispora longispora]BFE83331.1 hypothetical protein GCM10020093_059320 [Planobispora longispora]GIH77456.1 hypothetical protein Plo01_38850 [Planobispora longispora]
MKSLIMQMPALTGLASACTGTTLPTARRRVVLTDAVAAQLRQEKSVLFQIQASRKAVRPAYPATDVPAAPMAEAGGDAQQTKHIGNGGLRGPQPWRHPQVT